MGYQDDLEEQSCASHILILEVRFSFELKFFSDNLVTSDRPVLPKLILLNVNYILNKNTEDKHQNDRNITMLSKKLLSLSLRREESLLIKELQQCQSQFNKLWSFNYKICIVDEN